MIGASGMLGGRICRAVAETFGPARLVVGDRREPRAREITSEYGGEATYAVVDVTDPSAIGRALVDVGCVIVAVPQHEPLVQHACITTGVPCLDVTADRSLVDTILDLDADGTTIVPMAGFFPGLSGVLAMDSLDGFDDPRGLDVGLSQSAQATAGATGVADMLELLGRPVAYRRGEESREVPGFGSARRVAFAYPDPIGERRHRLADFPERDYLAAHARTSEVNYWTGYDDDRLERLISVMERVGLLRAFSRTRLRTWLARPLVGLGGGGRPEYAGIGVRARGETDGELTETHRTLVFTSDYGATARAVVAMAGSLLDGEAPAGVRFPFELFTFDELRPYLDDVIVSERIVRPSRAAPRHAT